jgi:hypothetical protein
MTADTYCFYCYTETRGARVCDRCRDWGDYWARLTPAERRAEEQSMALHDQTRDGI